MLRTFLLIPVFYCIVCMVFSNHLTTLVGKRNKYGIHDSNLLRTVNVNPILDQLGSKNISSYIDTLQSADISWLVLRNYSKFKQVYKLQLNIYQWRYTQYTPSHNLEFFYHPNRPSLVIGEGIENLKAALEEKVYCTLEQFVP